MKSKHVGAFVVVLGIAGLALEAVAPNAWAGPRSQAKQPDRVDVLERDLAETRDRCRKLETSLAELQGELELITQRIAGEVQAAGQMQATLDESEKAGFTYGINPQSRELLLAGWRAQLEAQARPLAPVVVVPETSGRRGSR